MIVEEWPPTMNCLRTLTENRAKVIDLLHRSKDLDSELLCNFPKPGDIFGLPVIYALKFGPASSQKVCDGYRMQKRQSLSTNEILTLLGKIERCGCSSTVVIIFIRSTFNTEEIETRTQQDQLQLILSRCRFNDELRPIIIDEDNSREVCQLANRFNGKYCTDEITMRKHIIQHLHHSLFLYLEQLNKALCKEFYRLDERLESTDFVSRNLKLKNQDLDENGKAVLENMLAGLLQVNDRSLVKERCRLHRLTDIHADVYTVALEANHLLIDLSEKFNLWRDKRNPVPNSLPTSVGTGLLRIDGVFRYSIAFEKLIVNYDDRERAEAIMAEVENLLRDRGYNIPVILEYRKDRRRKIRKMNNHLEIRHGNRHGTLGIVATAKTSDNTTYRVGFTAAHIIHPTSQDSVFLKDLEIGPCLWPEDFDNLLYDMAVIKIEKNMDQLNLNFPTIDGHLNDVRMYDADVNDLRGQIVFKNGASTGFTKGTIIRIEIENTNADDNENGNSTNNDELAFIIIKKNIDSVVQFCAEGDSGSIVFSVENEDGTDDTTTVISVLQGSDQDNPSEYHSCHFKTCIQKYENESNETVDFQWINKT